MIKYRASKRGEVRYFTTFKQAKEFLNLPTNSREVLRFTNLYVTKFSYDKRLKENKGLSSDKSWKWGNIDILNDWHYTG